jgi:uncharacterized Zn finger protein (UPF0148 family)
VAITRIECPECGAGLKSPSGFKAGQSVACPKCETYFTVDEPADDEDEVERPKKKAVKAASARDDDDEDVADQPRKNKKKKRRDDDDDEEKSYKNSPLRYVVLGVLVVIMIVLGIMLILKKKNEREEANAAPADERPVNTDPVIPPQGKQVGGPKGRPGNVGMPAKQPVAIAGINPQQQPKAVGPLNGFFGDPGGATPDGKQLIASLSAKLASDWEGTAPDGSVHKVSYQSNGTFRHQVVGGKSVSGTWQVVRLLGSRGLKLNRDGKMVNVVFEGDELIHDTGGGETVVLRAIRR